MREFVFETRPIDVAPIDFCAAVQTWLNGAPNGVLDGSLSAAANTLTDLAPAVDPRAFESQLVRLATGEQSGSASREAGAQVLLDLWQAARDGSFLRHGR